MALFHAPSQPPQQPKKKGRQPQSRKRIPSRRSLLPRQQGRPYRKAKRRCRILTGSLRKLLAIETDLAKIELTSRGLEIRHYFLKRYKTRYHNDIEPKDTYFYNQHVQLINTTRNAAINIIFVHKRGKTRQYRIARFHYAGSKLLLTRSQQGFVPSTTHMIRNGKEIKKSLSLRQ